ncbi:MAG TPA: hypothetical protein VM369_08130 [Candidatus Binatia bacterium]|nr:hypothetical protein [Candidatus Binatia bacterium]
MTFPQRARLAGGVAALLPAPALAHSFGKLYNLPVPLWLYLYGAAAALLVSFLMVGWFVNAGAAAANLRTRVLDSEFFRSADAPAVRAVLRALSLAGLWLCIATGLFGRNNAYQNFNMTWFWIVFVLGFTYLTALLGDLYAVVNPWRVMVDAIARRRPGSFSGRRQYPARLAYYPALALYMAFIWIELFGATRPLSLSVILLAYTALNFGAAWWWGAAAWFRYGEFFAVFLRLVAKMSVFEYAGQDGRRQLRLRQPFAGLLAERAEHHSLLLFVLFMLSSTAFDGIKDTVWWVSIFWKGIYPQLLMPLVGPDLVRTYPFLLKLYLVFQTASLVASAWFYLAIYRIFVWMAQRIAASRRSLPDLTLQFAFSLIPIAFVYNVTHYFTLIFTQGSQIVRLVSDPFGLGWDIFATRRWLLTPFAPEPGTVWHTQVWLILFGHIVSVYLSHLEALKAFPTQRHAALSQLPMLLLMMAFTTLGLWILSLPIQAGIPVKG